MLSQSTIVAVRAYPDMVGVLQDYVTLRKRGRNYLGLCPFHTEKTPSFTVSPEKQLYYCFGCQASGDLISFIQRIEHLGFQESVELIARRGGIAIEMAPDHDRVQRPEDKVRTAVQDILAQARRLFSAKLTPDTEAYKYVISREISPESIARFELGYFPMTFQLGEALLSHEVTPELLNKTGLGTVGDRGAFSSSFRDRLMVPIFDERGRTVGFGARRLDGESIAKYINSEETLLFNKGTLLFGLHLAKSEIKRQDAVILVEGYLDVIMMHQYGFVNTVASMGTALTSEQAQRLKRLCGHVFLAFDQDNAGLAAVDRAYSVLSDIGVGVRVIRFSSKDPADYLLSVGGEGMRTALEDSVSYVSFKFDELVRTIGVGSIQNVSKIVDTIVPFLKQEPDTIVRHHYVKSISKTLGIEQDVLMAKVSDLGYALPRKRLFQTSQQRQSKYVLAEEYILFFLASNREVQASILYRLGDSPLITESGRELADAIVRAEHVHHDLLAMLPEEHSQRLSQILVQYSGESLENWELYCDVILQYHREARIRELKAEIQNMESSGQGHELEQALAELQSLIHYSEEAGV
jgi:DNA primase